MVSCSINNTGLFPLSAGLLCLQVLCVEACRPAMAWAGAAEEEAVAAVGVGVTMVSGGTEAVVVVGIITTITGEGGLLLTTNTTIIATTLPITITQITITGTTSETLQLSIVVMLECSVC